MKNIDKRDFWLHDKTNDSYIHICEGTGDNLLYEDTEQGYIDYIYYGTFESLNDVYEQNETGGGMVLLTEYYVDLTLDDIVNRVLDMEDLLGIEYDLYEGD